MSWRPVCRPPVSKEQVSEALRRRLDHLVPRGEIWSCGGPTGNPDRRNPVVGIVEGREPHLLPGVPEPASMTQPRRQATGQASICKPS
jgi:hypothetical protein